MKQVKPDDMSFNQSRWAGVADSEAREQRDALLAQLNRIITGAQRTMDGKNFRRWATRIITVVRRLAPSKRKPAKRSRSTS